MGSLAQVEPIGEIADAVRIGAINVGINFLFSSPAPTGCSLPRRTGALRECRYYRLYDDGSGSTRATCRAGGGWPGDRHGEFCFLALKRPVKRKPFIDVAGSVSSPDGLPLHRVGFDCPAGAAMLHKQQVAARRAWRADLNCRDCEIVMQHRPFALAQFDTVDAAKLGRRGIERGGERCAVGFRCIDPWQQQEGKQCP